MNTSVLVFILVLSILSLSASGKNSAFITPMLQVFTSLLLLINTCVNDLYAKQQHIGCSVSIVKHLMSGSAEILLNARIILAEIDAFILVPTLGLAEA